MTKRYSPCVGARGPASRDDLCDDRDNDCDGMIDEDVPDKGQPCSLGDGDCRTWGVRVCSPDGVGTVCTAKPFKPTAEICDGLDNDCDGKRDNLSPLPKEECNDRDDDCDGLVDFSIVNGKPVPACECTDRPVVVSEKYLQQKFEACTDEPPDCSLTTPNAACGTSGLSMSFCVKACAPGSLEPWAQCSFRNINLKDFDSDWGNSGLLRVSFHLMQPYKGGISLWYGEYPARKRIQLFTWDERQNGVREGWYTKYFPPSSAFCPNYGPTDTFTEAQMPLACRRKPWACRDGKWTSIGSGDQCKFSYENVPLWITVEDCTAGAGGSNTISSFQVEYLGQQCFCSSDAPCEKRGNTCRSATFPTYTDPPDVAGVPYIKENLSMSNVCRSRVE